MKINKLNLLWVIFLLIGTISAQKTWEKPFQTWSKEDAVKILNVSPWVQSYQSTEGMAAIERGEISQSQSNLRIGGGGQNQVTGSTARNLAVPAVFIRLHSALPVRQALVRLQQIENGYDKMDEKKRTQFDNAMKNILECPLCQNYYIVTMAKSINTSGQEVEDGLFQTMKPEQLKGNVWLVNGKGDKLELEQFLAPKGAKDLAIFFFKRRDDKGNNFITPESKSFKFVFNNDFLSTNNPYAKFLPRNFEFKVASLIEENNLLF